MNGAVDAPGNFVSEWFGHRMYPAVVSTATSLTDQRDRKCPFLSEAKSTFQECIKAPTSKGVCTISSRSNGPRQDWVVCPYRAFDRQLFRHIVARLYQFPPDAVVHMYPAPVLGSVETQAEVLRLVEAGETVLVYFDQKMGGEIQVSPTERSPQISFDTTFVQLLRGEEEEVALGRFAIVEIQTMDFHGSYRRAVQNLQDALRLHKDDFPAVVESNPDWMSEGIEGPNIANVFKRTFYQLMFKFEMALTPACAGTALAIPSAVWDSWQKFLGMPDLEEEEAGVYRLAASEDRGRHGFPAVIYVFDFDGNAGQTPSPMRIQRIIRTSAEALAHQALEEAPKGAIAQLNESLYPTLYRRLREYWQLDIEIPTSLRQAGGVEIVDETRPIEEAELDD